MYTRLIQTKAQWFYSRHFVEFCKMFSNELQTDSDTTALIVKFIIQQEYHTYFIFIAAAIAEGKKRNENNLNVNHKSTCISIYFVPALLPSIAVGNAVVSQKYLFTCLSAQYMMQKDLSTPVHWHENTSNEWGVLKSILPYTQAGSVEPMSLAGLNKSCEIKNKILPRSKTVVFLILLPTTNVTECAVMLPIWGSIALMPI